MKVAAFIPARSGSKRVPGKNRAEVGGRSLLTRAIESAIGDKWRGSLDCSDLPDGPCDTCTVSTDDDAASAVAHACTMWLPYGEPIHMVDVHQRPAQLATDHAQIETAMDHWWRRLDEKPDVLVLLQPTSPFRTADHVKAALSLLTSTGCDSVIGVTSGHESHFAGRLKPRESDGGAPWFQWQPFSPIDSISARPRTQDLAPRGTDNGSLYVTTRAAWERSGLRVSGSIAALPMTWLEGFDIDTPEQLEAARAIAERMGI